MQPEQPLIAPTLMGRGGDTALGMEQRSPEQRPPSAASPRAAVQVVMLQPLLAAASVPLYAGPIQWMGQLAGPISGFVGGGTLPLPRAVGIGRPDGGGRGGGVGPVRARKTKRMDRRLTHWQCSYCRRETPNDSRSTKCGHCGEAKAQLRDADANGREAARRAQRAKEYQGRSLNALGVGTASVPRAAQGVFERTRADALVRWETEQLEQYTGAASYLRREDCVLGVIESFYIVQTGARVSVIDECKRSCITETDVARLFNAVGRRVATGVPGEDTFPMGGYFNEFRREGVSVELVRELRTVVTGAIAAIGGDVSAITASANSFRKWYSDAQNATAVALLGRGGAVNIAIMRAAKQVFARWYCPGGRLYVPGAVSELASPAAFGDFEVPGGVVRDLLYSLYSQPTSKWLARVDRAERRMPEGGRVAGTQAATTTMSERTMRSGRVVEFAVDDRDMEATRARAPEGPVARFRDISNGYRSQRRC